MSLTPSTREIDAKSLISILIAELRASGIDMNFIFDEINSRISENPFRDYDFDREHQASINKMKLDNAKTLDALAINVKTLIDIKKYAIPKEIKDQNDKTKILNFQIYTALVDATKFAEENLEKVNMAVGVIYNLFDKGMKAEDITGILTNNFKFNSYMSKDPAMKDAINKLRQIYSELPLVIKRAVSTIQEFHAAEKNAEKKIDKKAAVKAEKGLEKTVGKSAAVKVEKKVEKNAEVPAGKKTEKKNAYFPSAKQEVKEKKEVQKTSNLAVKSPSPGIYIKPKEVKQAAKLEKSGKVSDLKRFFEQQPPPSKPPIKTGPGIKPR